MDKADKFIKLGDSAFKTLTELLKVGNTLITAIKEFLPKDGTQVSHQVGNVLHSLKLAFYKFYVYAERVNNFYWYGRNEDRMRSVTERIERGNLEELLDFIDDLARCLAGADGIYEDSMKAFQEVRRSSLDGAEYCSRQARKAKTKKGITTAGGGTVAGVAAGGTLVAAGVAGGIALSVAAGFFTFGIGTVVGLGLTAAGGVTGAAACAGVSAITHICASHFNKMEEKLKCLKVAFKQAHSTVSTMTTEILTLKIELEEISNDVYAVQDAQNKYRLTSTLLHVVKRLFQRFDECHNQSSKFLQDLKEVDDKLKDIQF